MWYNICDKITQNPGTYRGKVCMAKKKRRAAALISAIMAVAMTFSGCAGEGDTVTDTTDETTEETTMKEETRVPIPKVDQPDATELPGAKDADWTAVPMTTEYQYENGIQGGEGCQWMLYITYANTDGNIAYAGSDVAGMYRSKDGGVTWEPCTVGIRSSAATGIEVDPTNADRVLIVGCNSGPFDENGLYLSTDGGDTFHRTLQMNIVGHRDFRPQIAWDMSSYDESFGGCKVVYWSRETEIYNNGGYKETALYRSDDGGENWELISTDEKIGGAMIFCDPVSGDLYAGNENGTFVSRDGGKSFELILEGECLSLDVVYNNPGYVYVTKQDALYISSDGGKSFNKMSESGYPSSGNPSHIRVSPADHDYIVLQNDMMSRGQYLSDTYFSHDGGKTWKKSGRHDEISFIPYNQRQGNLAWHPTDRNICLSFGGDYILRSTDGGENFEWSNSGFNGGCFTRIAINVNNPDLMALGNQDYSGAFTTDGGKTWKYTNFYERWGGYSYGAYVVDKQTIIFVCRDFSGKYGNGEGVDVIIRSTDGGETWKSTGIVLTESLNILGVVGEENVLLVGGWRSEDKGETWTKSDEKEGFDAVLTYASDGSAVFGLRGSWIVKSTDKGLTWEKYGRAGVNVLDMAYDNQNDTLWVLGEGGYLFRFIDGERVNIKLPTGGEMRTRTIACDPFDGNIIYVGNALNIAKSEASVIRSTDGGATWENMTKTATDGVTGMDGGVEASFMRTDPETGDLYVIGGCRGMWKTKRPE